MPYLAELGRIAHHEGIPIMRPMIMEFPNDRGAATVDTQYLLGDSIMVALVFTAGGDVDFYLDPCCHEDPGRTGRTTTTPTG